MDQFRAKPKDISIHTLLAESDGYAGQFDYDTFISIHALLAESDYLLCRCSRGSRNFYPRSPCGERP